MKIKRKLGKFSIVILFGFFIFLIYKCIIAGHSMPIMKENAISEFRMVELGGVSQSVLIRGEDRNNPVILYIHGGPGNPETSFIVPYQKEWEKYYTVVNWDQRGSGKSYHNNIDTNTLTSEQIYLDAVELTQYLKEEFKTEKIYLVCHSYGTYIGMKCINNNPDDYYAYVGMGQIGNQQHNEKYILDYAIKKSEEEGNEKALEELNGLGELPYTDYEFGKKISTARKWTTYYGGSIYGATNTNRFVLETIIRPEYNIIDIIHYINGEKLYYANSEKDIARLELFSANLSEEIPVVDTNVFFVQGKNDYITSFQSCEEYFEVLQAPYKELIALEECAHNPIIEDTSKVNHILINKVLAQTRINQ